MSNVIELLSVWTGKFPTKKVWTFIDDGGKEVDNVTYLELSKITDELATFLLAKGMVLTSRTACFGTLCTSHRVLHSTCTGSTFGIA